MCKKFIIENSENSQCFAILYIRYHNGRDRGFLKYYQVNGDNTLVEVEDIEQGWTELSVKLINEADKVCKVNDAVLWSY
jgi:hypothetical protein